MPLRRLVDRLSLRSRLTVWVVGFSALIKLSIGIVFFLYQSRAINDFFNEHLQKRTDGMMTTVIAGTPGMDGDALKAMAIAQSQYAMFSGFILTIYDDQGNVIATTREHGMRTPVDRSDLGLIAKTRAVWFERVPADQVREFDPDAEWARVISRGFRGRDGENYVLAAATADSYAEHMVGLLKRALLVVLPTGVLITGVSGWFIAGLAVRPLEEVRRTAARFSPESIDQKLHVHSSSPELSRLEEELNRARERMALAFAAQERFMSNVSHELKTPIAVLMTEAQTIDLRHADPSVRDFARGVCEEMRRLGSMVDSFLLLTRVREGRALSQNRLCPANDLIMDSVGHCLSMAIQHGVRLDPMLCDDEPAPCVRGDPSLLRTMLDNLIRNAIRFSPREGMIHVSARVEDGEVVLRVRDHGAGIPVHVIDRIFDRFVQAPEEHRRGRGHGLGLEIAQGIAELHGGQIAVRNCLPEPSMNGRAGSAAEGAPSPDGCEFMVRLPRTTDAADNRSDSEATEPARRD